MKEKLKKIALNWKVLLLVFFLLLAYVAINPDFNTSGVTITHVEKNTSAALAGLESPESNSPRAREVITSIQGQRINSEEDYYNIVSELLEAEPDTPVEIRTNKNKNGYVLYTKPLIQYIVTDELENITQNITEEVFDEETNTTINQTTEIAIEQNKTIENIIGIQELGISIKAAPSSNIKKGLDLEGGTRVILEPEGDIEQDQFDLLIANMKQRLNVYGLSDIIVRPTKDLVGNQYILVEIAGVNQEEVQELIAQQGKFEAKIGNVTVFSGGSDIKAVIRSADQSGIDPTQPCGVLPDGSYSCRYYFGIVLSPESAQRQADVTVDLPVITTDENGQALPRDRQYLAGQLDFYLDDILTDSLNIGADLKGRPVTDIQISGSGTGPTEQEAITSALKDMKRMQTILITGSLPVKLNIVKTDAISPILGREFLNNAIMIGLFALLAVIIITFIIYRKLIIVVPMILTIFAELFLILGFAAAAGWNLDLAAIAGILLVIGTGLDHLIIITDETVRKTVEQLTWLQKIKRAFTIVVVAGLTTIGAMLPLMAAGAGLLKGFALTTTVGVLIGIMIARPAYSAVIEILLKNN